MNIERIPAGPLETNGYVLSKDGENIVIDPSLNPTPIVDVLIEKGGTLKAILLTHAHFDHYLGIYELFEKFGNVPLYAHPEAALLLGNCEYSGALSVGEREPFDGEQLFLEEGVFKLDPFEFEIFHIPGHTPGGVAIYDGENCFTGDSLFAGSIGRTDFGYSNHDDLMKNIKEKLLTLPDDTIIWPGHANRSTIGREKKSNPYLREIL
jgi:hydroxyacylglutathione hydrolase